MTRLVLTALAAAALATPVWAQSAVKVGYSDLNLESRNGAKVMLARLDAAAHRACGPAPSIQALRRSDEYRDCVRKTLEEAVSSLHAPLVTAAYQGSEATHVATADGPR